MRNIELLFALDGENTSFIWLESILKEAAKETPLSYFEGDGFWKDGSSETVISVRSIFWKPETDEEFKTRLELLKSLADRIRVEFDQTVTILLTESAYLVLKSKS